MDIHSILNELHICKDVIKIIVQYNATLLGFVPKDDGSISVQDYHTKSKLKLLKPDTPITNPNHCNSLLVIPEFDWVMRSSSDNFVHIWDFSTGDLILSRGFQSFFPSGSGSHRSMFWVPELNKALLIDRNRIHIFTMRKQTKDVHVHTIDQNYVDVMRVEPQPSNPFEFRITHGGWPGIYPKRVTIFNLQTMSFRKNESKDESLSIKQIWHLNKTSSLMLLFGADEGKSFVQCLANGVRLPISINGLNGFQGTLYDCLRIHDSEYRLHFFSYTPGQDDQETDFKAILEFEEGKYSFRIISCPLRRDSTQAVILSEHHYLELIPKLQSIESTLMFVRISFVVFFVSILLYRLIYF